MMVSLGGDQSITRSVSAKRLEKDRTSVIFLKYVLDHSSEKQGERMGLERGPILSVYIHSDLNCPQKLIYLLHPRTNKQICSEP